MEDTLATLGGGRVLVLGRSPQVLETVLQDLRELGIDAVGSTRLERATEEFDAATFDLLAIGGGVDAVQRAEIKQAFTSRNGGLRLLDTQAPVAARQVASALQGGETRPEVDLEAYLARIGYDGPRTPTLGTLRALHERHIDRIAFEAIDVMLGHGVDISPSAIDAKLIAGRRGGYCYEQNGLFKRVLEALGFDVEGVAARVRWLLPAGHPPTARTHMALWVTLDGTPWLVDAGFGASVPAAPLRIDTPEPQVTRHDVYRVFPFGPDLLVQAEREGKWLALYELSPEAMHQADYELANWFTSTHPASPFRKSLVAARTAPEARYALLNGRFTVRYPDGETEKHELDADGIERRLTDVFGLSVEAAWRPMIERAAATAVEAA